MTEPKDSRSRGIDVEPESGEARNEKQRRALIRAERLVPARKPGSLSAAPPPLPSSGRGLSAILDDMRDE
ncbi:hypothetical protein [Gordonia otitidis]|nr:hypothetical protein [Gordonia otitidis]